MLTYLIGFAIAVWFALIALSIEESVWKWSLGGIVSYIAPYFLWKIFLAEELVYDQTSLLVFIVAGMFIGVFCAVVLLSFLLQMAVQKRSGHGSDDKKAPEIGLSSIQRWRYILPIVMSVLTSIVSVSLLRYDIIQNEVLHGALIPISIIAMIGSLFVRKPTPSLLLGIGLGLFFAVPYGLGLFYMDPIDFTEARASEELLGALIGLPLLCMMTGAASGLFFGIFVRSLEAIRIRYRWIISTY